MSKRLLDGPDQKPAEFQPVLARTKKQKRKTADMFSLNVFSLRHALTHQGGLFKH